MTFMDTFITITIILFGILLIWSRVQQQKMIETVNELKQIVEGFATRDVAQ